MGITFPNPEAQREVMEAALVRAGVSPSQVTLVEAHATGTSAGDPVECAQIRAVYGGPSDLGPCRLGSVKASLGHLESAAGIASVIKVILAMRHKKIPPQLHLEHLNPEIDLSGSRIVLEREAVDWNPAGPRMAAVSSFRLRRRERSRHLS